MGRASIQIVHFFTMVISRRKYQWYTVSQLLFEQNIWQAWSQVFLPTKLSILLKEIFFVSLKSIKITSKIQIYEVCDVGHVTYSFINMLFTSTWIFDDKLCPQILSVGTTANSPLNNGIFVLQTNQIVWLHETICICICIYLINRYHQKESLNSDGQQFHKYQRNKKSPLSSDHWTQKKSMTLWEIQVLAWDRHKNVTGLNLQ